MMTDFDDSYAMNLERSKTISNTSVSDFYPKANFHVPLSNQNNYHGVDIDTATIVSIASSCIILISGCIAVVCLIMYMKKTDMLYRSRTCAKCGAHVAQDTPNMVEHETEKTERLKNMANLEEYQMASQSQQNLNNKEIDSIVIYQSSLLGKQATNHPIPFNTDRIIYKNPLIKSTAIIDHGLKNEKNLFFEDDEAAPYATFNLPGFESDSKISDTYETFAAKFSEPPYMLLKKGIECPPQYADSVEYKIHNSIPNDKAHESELDDHIYQSMALSQYQSIASCSTNQDELIRAYEYGKQHKQKLSKMQSEVMQQLQKNGLENIYRSFQSDHESPTDPGIREFTKSPPKPNEKRQGIVFHHQPGTEEFLNLSSQMVETPKRNEENSKLETNTVDTPNSSSIPTTSSEASGNDDESSPSVDSEFGNDEASSSTATPDEQSATNQKKFGAIPRDRSRNPSWANYTTMKSTNFLGPQFDDSENTQQDKPLSAFDVDENEKKNFNDLQSKISKLDKSSPQFNKTSSSRDSGLLYQRESFSNKSPIEPIYRKQSLKTHEPDMDLDTIF